MTVTLPALIGLDYPQEHHGHMWRTTGCWPIDFLRVGWWPARLTEQELADTERHALTMLADVFAERRRRAGGGMTLPPL